VDEALWVIEKVVLKAKSERKDAFASNLLKIPEMLLFMNVIMVVVY